MSTQATTKWVLDPTHTEIGFKAKHLMITTVSGKFEKFEGVVETEGDDLSTAKISFVAETNSINTANEQRDGHLKSAEFFDAEKFPQLKFVSTKFEKVDDENYKLYGDLTVRDVTKAVQLSIEYSGTAQDPWGNTKAGFVLSGKINRKDWGLNWNVGLETGGVLVSEEIKLNCEVQLVKQA